MCITYHLFDVLTTYSAYLCMIGSSVMIFFDLGKNCYTEEEFLHRGRNFAAAQRYTEERISTYTYTEEQYQQTQYTVLFRNQ